MLNKEERAGTAYLQKKKKKNVKAAKKQMALGWAQLREVCSPIFWVEWKNEKRGARSSDIALPRKKAKREHFARTCGDRGI